MNKNLNIQILIILTIIATILLMWGLPLFSSSETRYAEIARKMVVSGNYFLPMISEGELFWNKPFLSFTLQAFSIKILGINNFAPRLPQLLELFLTLFLLLFLAKSELKSYSKYHLLAVAFSIPIFLIISISVSTDILLTLAVTLVMVGFWFAFVRDRRGFAVLFFAGIIIGFFTKGLTILVLTGVPIFLWCLYTKNLINFFRKFPLILGAIITTSTIGLWFFVMEKYYPGFTKYFIITEHFGRFFGISDLPMKENYGFFHTKPYGTSIIYSIAMFFPHSLFLIYSFFKKYDQNTTIFFSSLSFLNSRFSNAQFLPFLLFWIGGIVGILVFSSHIILPYVLPIAPAVIILFSVFIINNIRFLKAIQLFTLMLLIIASIFCFIKRDVFVYAIDNDKQNYFLPIIESYEAHLRKNPSLNTSIYQAGGYDFGSLYYSNGEVKSIEGLTILPAGEYFLILEQSAKYAQVDISTCSVVGEFPKYNLLYCKNEHS